MAAVREDFTIRAGRDDTLVFTIEADEGQSLDEATIEWHVARHVGSDQAMITKSSGSGIEMTSELAFEVDLTGEDTFAMDGIYYHEARVTTSEGTRITVTYGYMTVEASLIGETSL